MIDQVFEELSAAAKGEVIEEIQELIKNRSARCFVWTCTCLLPYVSWRTRTVRTTKPCFSKFMKSGPLRLFGATSF